MSERATRIRQRVVWPLALLLLMGATGTAFADAYNQDLPVSAPLTSEWTGELSADSLGTVVAPEPTVTPAPSTPQIKIVFPPPPPPPAANGRKRGSASERIAQAAAAGVTTPTQWCDGKYGATASASSLSGLLAAVNAERARFGLGSLAWSSSLESQAQNWSATMAAASGGISHGDVPSPGGQNVGRWTDSTASVSSAISVFHGGWMTSTGHCSNILYGGWTTFGAAFVQSPEGWWYATENFQ